MTGMITDQLSSGVHHGCDGEQHLITASTKLEVRSAAAQRPELVITLLLRYSGFSLESYLAEIES